jgi:hypothetical protein
MQRPKLWGSEMSRLFGAWTTGFGMFSNGFAVTRRSTRCADVLQVGVDERAALLDPEVRVQLLGHSVDLAGVEPLRTTSISQPQPRCRAPAPTGCRCPPRPAPGTRSPRPCRATCRRRAGTARRSRGRPARRSSASGARPGPSWPGSGRTGDRPRASAPVTVGGIIHDQSSAVICRRTSRAPTSRPGSGRRQSPAAQPRSRHRFLRTMSTLFQSPDFDMPPMTSWRSWART